MSKSNIKQCLIQDRGFARRCDEPREHQEYFHASLSQGFSKAFEKWEGCSFLAKAVEEFRANVLY